VTSVPARPYGGVMVRALLMGLAAIVIVVVVISVLIKVLLFGVVLALVAGATFLVFRARRLGRYRR
jgi:hypothetical protein